MSNYQDIWKTCAVSDLRSSTGIEAFVERIRSFYISSQSFVDAENEILNLILEGYGTGEFFGEECNILEVIKEYREVIEDRKNHRINYHNIGQKAKSERHFFLAKINTKYMKLARGLSKRVQKALFAASLIASMTIERIMSVTVIDVVEEGNVDGERFIDALIDDILVYCEPYPGKRSVIVMDNAQVHMKLLITAACQERGVIVIYLPTYTFDYNPIELVFNTAVSKLLTVYGRALLPPDSNFGD
jgi:DNA-binding ferritin-like protein (Dps family)